MLTFAGAFYVLSSNGMKSAGYAAVPMVLCIACLSGDRHNKDKK